MQSPSTEFPVTGCTQLYLDAVVLDTQLLSGVHEGFSSFLGKKKKE